jgi:hypothetical protein
MSINEREDSTAVVWLVGSVSIFLLMLTTAVSIGARHPHLTVGLGFVEVFAAWRMKASPGAESLRVIVLVSGAVTLLSGWIYLVVR